MSKTPAAKKKKNVQVVVRVRPLSGSEIVQKSRNVVSVDNDNKMVYLRDKATMRPFGAFDKVYDEETGQSKIYMEVVAPLITQVLNGYGQTGSGKTFTMEGHHDEAGGFSWENDPKAGVIPRTLHHIFSQLEAEKPEDYSVRASYVELYNEQLFDLLNTSTQPLRVYDNKDNGVIISGMEDVPVRSRNEVYDLLKRGADRRKTASTLMNINSSRSHSVFTLTVTTRQTIDNEELLRVGKIHLVDLAGSENVGRSGAVDARAREAGNINTSLLALGRVITALTSNAAHIPYRESKLTRILQDSLGGKTITTIIATLSPASSNFEESVSTLEYGQRAKNIKNNPEANKCVSRKRILLAYDEEISRLQRDLAAARQGGGFYVDAENYEQMQAENAESKEKIETLEMELTEQLVQLTNVREDIRYMDEQYRKAYESLKDRTARYERKVREQERLRKELSDLNGNYHSALDALTTYEGIADKLRKREKKFQEASVVFFNELETTHGKIEQLREIASSNDRLLGNFAAKFIGGVHEVKSVVTDRLLEDNSRLGASLDEKGETLRSELTERLDQGVASAQKLLEELAGRESKLRQLTASCATTTSDGLCAVWTDLDTYFKAALTRESGLRTLLDHSVGLIATFEDVVKTQRTTFSEQLSKARAEQEQEFAEDERRLAELGSLVAQLKDRRQNAKRLYSAALDSLARPFEQVTEGAERLADAVCDAKKAKLQSEEAEKIVLRNSAAIDAQLRAVTSSAQASLGAMRTEQEALSREVGEGARCVCSTNESAKDRLAEGVEELANTVAAQGEAVRVACDQTTQRLGGLQTELERFLHQELLREEHSGRTPDRRPLNELAQVNFSPLPSSKQLLKDLAKTPQRASVFRVRDTVLESDLPVASPNTLKGGLPSVFAAAKRAEEESENL